MLAIIDYIYVLAIKPTLLSSVSSILISLLANIVLSYIRKSAPPLLRKYKNSISIFALLSATAALSVASFILILNHKDYGTFGVLGTFFVSMLLWLVFFHVAFRSAGKKITAHNGVFRLFTNEWVKKIDYVYLTVSSISLVRIVVGTTDPGTSYDFLNALAAVSLGMAMSLRMTRTSIEIYKWS